jgi:hypothetical protein
MSAAWTTWIGVDAPALAETSEGARTTADAETVAAVAASPKTNVPRGTLDTMAIAVWPIWVIVSWEATRSMNEDTPPPDPPNDAWADVGSPKLNRCRQLREPTDASFGAFPARRTLRRNGSEIKDPAADSMPAKLRRSDARARCTRARAFSIEMFSAAAKSP